MKTIRSTALATIFLVMSSLAPSHATILYVESTNGDNNNLGINWQTAKKTITAAISIANTGDEIWVGSGTYEECIDLKDGVGLYGGFAGTETQRDQRNTTSNLTLIDAKGSGSAVTIKNCSSASTVIDGFTIQRGYAYYGAGIYCEGASPIISNNTITDCVAEGYTEWVLDWFDPNGMPYFIGTGYGGNGGAIYCRDASPAITGNNFVGNSALGWNTGYSIPWGGMGQPAWGEGYGGAICCTGASSASIEHNSLSDNTSCYAGGAIYCENPASATIAWNTFTGNVTSAGESNGYGGSGGAVYCWTDSKALIANNRIERNVASEDGGGLLCSGALVIVCNNVIRGNSAGFYGGGISCSRGSVVNNTIVGNATYHCYGGGISCVSYKSTLIANNIVAFNSSGIWGFHGGGQTDGLVTLRNNCVYNPDGINFDGVADVTSKDGNISVDPKLIAPRYGRVAITPDSPCIDAGEDTLVKPDWTDVTGCPRIQFNHVDIGAYESDMISVSYAPPVFRVSTVGDDAQDGSTWQTAKRTIQAAIDAADAVGGDVWVAEGTYNTSLALKMDAHLFGGFTGHETSIMERNTVAHLSIISGTASGSVVDATNTGFRLATIDGFTIQNGLEGVTCNYSAPTISNNIITNNGNTSYGTVGGVLCNWASPLIIGNSISGNKGGIYCTFSHAVVTGNTISGNSGTGIRCEKLAVLTITKNKILSNRGSSCGGISCGYWSDAIIRQNTISGNSASWGGGGLYCASCIPSIECNIIQDNVAGDTYYKSDGGGIYISGGGRVMGNLISGNRASRNGGGIYYSAQSSVTTANNTFVGNTAWENGGALFVNCPQAGLVSPSIFNNIIALNTNGIFVLGSGSPKLRSNCFYNPSGSNYGGNAVRGDKDIVTDPVFFDADHYDYHLKSKSPCIDAAIDDLWLINSDLDGHLRPIDGNDDGVDATDMGCYEAYKQCASLAEVKTLPDGSTLRFAGGIVTASQPDRFYIETSDRIVGIGVSGSASVLGRNVSIEGTVVTANQERMINATWVGDGGSAAAPLPWFMTEKSLGGGGLGLQSGVSDWHFVGKTDETGRHYSERTLAASGGANNIGLLVKMVGQVSQSGAGYFYLDGGTGFDDGDPNVKGVRVDWPYPLLAPPIGSFVSVTGISSCRVVSHIDNAEVVVRFLRPVTADSVVVVRPAQ
ncbi:MAG: right-handed parallel beta-helix repeat-containing protein [Armatimonadota bacterium]